jgi:hypothetical protein
VPLGTCNNNACNKQIICRAALYMLSEVSLNTKSRPLMFQATTVPVQLLCKHDKGATDMLQVIPLTVYQACPENHSLLVIQYQWQRF